MTDLIDRSKLIAELEGFKMSMGDVIIRLIVDRVIELTQQQPAVDTAMVELLEDRIRLVYPGGAIQEVVL